MAKTLKNYDPQAIMEICFALIIIFLLMHIYSYLSDLEHCPCFVGTNKQVDITYMKFFQIFEIVVYGMLILSIMMLKYGKAKGGKSQKQFLTFISLLSFILMFSIMAYMGYNVIHFYKTLKNDCACANKWQKYFIYAQGIFSSLSAIQLFTILLFIIQMTLFQYKSN